MPHDTTDTPEQVTSPSFVIGIGASAGGLESLERFFDGVDDSLKATFVVVQHLSPNHETMMDSLLKRHTDMPVMIAQEGQQLHTNHVYVMPPKKEVTLDGLTIRLHDQNRSELPHLPIDRFFSSLARVPGVAKAGVVLSGTGSDGSRGVVAINRAGGVVAVESEATAKFSGMPNAAAATGIVDYTLPPQSMANQLACWFAEHDDLGTWDNRDDEQQQIFRLLRDHCHINFANYKSSTVTRRLDRRLAMRGVQSLKEYVAVLQAEPDEVDELYRDMLIGVTKFFRDPSCWDLLQEKIVDKLFKDADPKKGLRVWVSGCATGEEAYSMAMMLHEARERLQSPVSFKVFASDVHPGSIKIAAQGYYRSETLTNVSLDRLEKYFVRSGDGYLISKDIRSSVVFAIHNILQDPPFTDIDLVSCRNLLIYFDSHGQRKALSMFHFGLRQGGVLFLGPSETTGRLSNEFSTIDEKCKVFAKRRNARLPQGIDLPLQIQPKLNVDPYAFQSDRSPQRERMRNYDRILDHVMPATVLVNSNRQVLESFGGIERYLRVPRRLFSNDLLDVAPADLQAPLSALFRRVQRDRTKVRLPVTGVELPNGDLGDLDIVMDPVPGASEEVPLYLIRFTVKETVRLEVLDRDADAATVQIEKDDRELSERILTLEDELRHSRENLQATIEELESSNEELQSTNEELISSNEELQSTNEELNSVNEELHTVNVEYQSKNAELRELNDDINHLFGSTDIGTIFLDGSLAIRRFTPRVATVFDLRPQDLGRSLSSFSHTLNIDDLTELTSKVLHDGEKFEQEVEDRYDNHYVLRLHPYQIEEQIAGVILTLTDITRLVESRRLAEKYQRRLQRAIDAVPILVSYVSSDEVYQYANQAYFDWLKRDRDEVIGRKVKDVIDSKAYANGQPHIKSVLEGHSQYFDQELKTPKGTINLAVSYIPDINRKGRVVGFYVSAANVTSLKRAERELAAAVESAKSANRAKSDFLAKMSHEIRSPMTSILGFADILDEQLNDPDNRSAIDIIRTNGQHLLNLINEILDLSKIESGNLELEKDHFDLPSLLMECHNTVLPKAERGQVELQFEVDESAKGSICSDRRRLRQIVLNLLTNAVKFAAGGHVSLRCSRCEDYFVIAVSDDGCGIAKESLPQLFQPFCQADDTSIRRHEGTGLGLTITKQLASQMDGDVSVESKLGEGSTFTVRLPWIEGKAEETIEDPQLRQKQLPSLNQKKILVIDDRRDIRFIAEHILVDAGARVTTAENGQDGLDKARAANELADPFDCVVTDIQMPEMDGYETATKMRSEGYAGPILALSASAMASDRAEALAAGCDEHLAKPINRTLFIRTIARLIGLLER
ncbi:PAS domain-containing protein [Stieleria sp. JC731]|uniref:chemotaxis protein CheB n=1 Tax=Pirellulaceae TaxID=2691357 RepID=UPI001E3568BD|nr:chemotaxis protein CheB [Stieleria sp. JC731]MCC9603239.1 PAS domain-containing protein [Stieleria sp. JC731]